MTDYNRKEKQEGIDGSCSLVEGFACSMTAIRYLPVFILSLPWVIMQYNRFSPLSVKSVLDYPPLFDYVRFCPGIIALFIMTVRSLILPRAVTGTCPPVSWVAPAGAVVSSVMQSARIIKRTCIFIS